MIEITVVAYPTRLYVTILVRSILNILYNNNTITKIKIYLVVFA